MAKASRPQIQGKPNPKKRKNVEVNRKYMVTTPPASEPLTLVEAKAWLKVDFTEDDALITSLISAARETVENYTLQKLLPQTITEKYDTLGNGLELSVYPVASAPTVTYTDENGGTQTLAAENFVFDNFKRMPRITPANGVSWPSTLQQDNAVTLVYIAGYANAAAVPAGIKNAMLKLIGKWYEVREESVRKMPTDVEWLLMQYRIML
jgi:uncharacterized phiE125 gp8 family phage protein